MLLISRRKQEVFIAGSTVPGRPFNDEGLALGPLARIYEANLVASIVVPAAFRTVPVAGTPTVAVLLLIGTKVFITSSQNLSSIL